MTVSIGGYSLCDGTLAGGVALSDMRMQVARSIDVAMPLRAVNPLTFDRIGRTTHFSFQVKRVHSTCEACEEFIVGLDTAIPSIGSVIITLNDGSTTIEVPVAKVINHESTETGATSFTTYNITGGPPATVVYSAILLESEDFILTEAGGHILLG